MPTRRPLTWIELGSPAPRALTEARLELHWAVQIVAAVPFNYRDPVPDDSHTNLDWEPEAGRFVGRGVGTVGAVPAVRAGDLTLAVLVDGRVQEERPLNGATLDDGYRWMAEAVGRSRPLVRRDYEMPSHPVGTGAPFRTGGSAALAELARWYTNGRQVLEQVRAADDRASEVRTWPHHFDMATRIALDPGADADHARSINVGLSPGDDAYDEPYLYVTPWPMPDAARLPPLRGDGAWHTQGFTAAVLTGSRIVAGGAAEQAARVEGFLTTALEASRALLGDREGKTDR